MEQLRSLARVNGWECCVLWKLSNDQRFLEWLDCCCTGAETRPQEFDFAAAAGPQCRDKLVHHSRTKGCDLLAQFPPFMQIEDCRVYAETLLSNQPKCLHLSHCANSVDIEPEFATRLLVPVQGGLVEFFAARKVSENQHFTNYVAEICNFILEKEVTVVNDLSLSEQQFETSDSIFLSDELMDQLYQFKVEDSSLYLKKDNFEMGRSSSISEEDAADAKFMKKNGKWPQSKNLIAERKRRKKLNERLYKLRSLVPIISKLDRASILGDAIDFVKELQKQKKSLEEELQQQSDDEYHEDTTDPLTEDATEKDEVEVRNIDGRNLLFVKMLFERKAGGFVRLLETLDQLGLEVIYVNVTTVGTLVSNVLQVQGKEGISCVMVDSNCLKDSLTHIVGVCSRSCAFGFLQLCQLLLPEEHPIVQKPVDPSWNLSRASLLLRKGSPILLLGRSGTEARGSGGVKESESQGKT
ncbi:hypothetical protein QQ045_011086 [Rhodiola kirilowii]